MNRNARLRVELPLVSLKIVFTLECKCSTFLFKRFANSYAAICHARDYRAGYGTMHIPVRVIQSGVICDNSAVRAAYIDAAAELERMVLTNLQTISLNSWDEHNRPKILLDQPGLNAVLLGWGCSVLEVQKVPRVAVSILVK